MLRDLLSYDRATFPITEAQAQSLISDLDHITTGDKRHANLYKQTIRGLLSYIFYPDLRSPRSEVPIGNGVMRMDIVYYNAAESGTLHDLKFATNSLKIVVEVKNSGKLRASYFQQIQSYLLDSVSKCCFLVFRGEIEDSYEKQLRHLWSMDYKVFLFNDEELVSLASQKIRNRGRSEDFAKYLNSVMQSKCQQY